MRLDPDCVRAILLAVEGVCDMGHFFDFPQDGLHIKGEFTSCEILYHARQCGLSGLFHKYSPDSGGFRVLDLSPKGHEFLANIRKDTVWNGVKEIAGKIGTGSLDAVTKIASNVITELIKAQFNISG